MPNEIMIPDSAVVTIGGTIDWWWIGQLAGPPLYSEVDQQEDLTLPRTRIIKDILSEGSWPVGGTDKKPQTWDVTPELLDLLAEEYESATEAGAFSNLYWGASTAGDQHDVVAESAICQIDKIFSANGRLWMVGYVDPATATKLRNPAYRVSVDVRANFKTGDGKSHPVFIKHVAIVDHPVVTGQLPFVRMSLLSGGTPEETMPEQTPVTPPAAEYVTKSDIQTMLAEHTKTLTETLIGRLSLDSAQRAAESSFKSRVSALFGAEKIDAAEQEALLNSGKAAGWDASVITAAESLVARLSLGSNSGKDGRKPDVSGGKGKSEADKELELLKANGIDAKFAV